MITADFVSEYLIVLGKNKNGFAYGWPDYRQSDE